MFDTRSGFWLIASIGIVGVLTTIGTILFAPDADLNYYTFAEAIGFPMTVLLPIIAVLAITGEWSQRTGLTTFTLVPHRHRVIAAKVIASLAVGVAAMLFALVIGVLGNLVGTAIAGTALVWNGTGARGLWGCSACGPGRGRWWSCRCPFLSGGGGELEEHLLEPAVGGAQLGEREIGLAGHQAHDRGVGVGAHRVVVGAAGLEPGLAQGAFESRHVGCPDDGACGPEQLGFGAARDDASRADHDDVVGDELDLVQQVRGQQDGAAAVGVVPEQVAHPPGTGRVQAVVRLVEDQHRGVADEGDRDAEPLAHPERVRADPALRSGLGQTDPFERLGDPSWPTITADSMSFAPLLAPLTVRCLLDRLVQHTP
jgi:hypothetical protein